MRLSSNWQSVTVADLGRVVTGKTPPTAKPHLYGAEYPFITPTDIDDYRYCDPARHLSEEGHNSQRNLLLPARSVCMTCIASIGKMCITARPSFTNQQINAVIVDEAKYDPFYVYYLLKTRIGHLRSIAGGAATPIVNKTTFSQVEVTVAPYSIQKRIAGMLSAYDELIENSRRRIRILESLGRALYREWFVHFRFPGHKRHPRAPSLLGEIPQGWRVIGLFDLAKVGYGKNLPTKKMKDDGPYPVYGAAKIIGRYTEFTRSGRTIICGCRGSVGEMQITEQRCYVTNNSFTFDPLNSDDFFWLFHALKDRGLRDVVGGAAQPQITLEGISSVELVTPPLPLRQQFQKIVAPMFEQAWVLDDQIQSLRRTRDVLLPNLLSGQIHVETA